MNKMVKNMITFSKLICFVGVVSWGLGLSAQVEEATGADVAAQKSQLHQAPPQRPRSFVMGHIRSNSILPRMPQYAAMQESLKSLREQYEAEAKKSENDFQRKFEEFMQGQKEFPKTILEKRQNELQIMLETNAEFRIKAQKLLSEAERSMLADVKVEMAEAISAVAQQKGVSIVYDLDNGSVPYLEPGMAADLTNAVLRYMGINPATPLPATDSMSALTPIQ